MLSTQAFSRLPIYQQPNLGYSVSNQGQPGGSGPTDSFSASAGEPELFTLNRQTFQALAQGQSGALLTPLAQSDWQSKAPFAPNLNFSGQ